MSNFGLRIKDAAGDILLNITDRITRFRYSTEVNADADDNVTLADIDGYSTIEFSIMLETGSGKCQHSVARSGTQISWVHQDGYAGIVKLYESAKSLIFVFMYT